MGQPQGVEGIYSEILNEPEIVAAMKHFKEEIDPSLISNYISDLDEFLRNKEKCDGCKGIKYCKQPVKGHHPELKPSYKQLKVAYTPCQYEMGRGLSRVEAGNPGFPRLVQVTSGGFSWWF